MAATAQNINTAPTYKVVDLFGKEQIFFIDKVAKKPDLFTDYDAFVDKFEAKKTTDDCYTPAEVYQTIIDHVGGYFDLTDKAVIRPFYPGGDFEAIDYPANCVVIDNPPFSIVTKIAKFYAERGIWFFIFAPHLTNFTADIDCSHIVVGASIVYENGAEVKTSFLSNMFGDVKVFGDAELYLKLKEIQDSKKANLPKYVYPDNVLTVSHVQYMVEKGVSISIDKKNTKHCRQLASQKQHGKTIFGSGFLLSNAAAQEKAAMEKAAMEKENVIVWELSKKEHDIINSLG